MSKRKKMFFGKLMNFGELVHDDQYKNVMLIDYDSEKELIQQQCKFMEFYKENHGQWARFMKETNGWVYSIDSPKGVLFHEDWILNKSPEISMEI